ncbi:MAG: CAP domain-containing protein [Eubacteriales bacterium]|nr:CAP domain-containing protein [Eubacteriales bacterium]
MDPNQGRQDYQQNAAGQSGSIKSAPHLLASLESGSFSPRQDSIGTCPAAGERRLSSILLLFMLLTSLTVCLLAGCGAGEDSASEQVENKLVGVSIKELPSLAKTEPSQEENADEVQAAAVEASPSYDPERPEEYLEYYLKERDLPLDIVENSDFIKAIRGKTKDEAIYYTLALLKVETSAKALSAEEKKAEPIRAGSARPQNEQEGSSHNLSTEQEASAQQQADDSSKQAAEANDSGAGSDVNANSAEQPGPENNQAASEGAENAENTEDTVQTTEESSATEPTPAPVTDDGTDQAVAEAVYALTNQARRSLGLVELSYDATLAGIAETRVWEIPELFSHTRPDGSSATRMGINAGFSMTAENISLYSWAASGQEIYDGFKNSPGHWGNMINPELTRLAVRTITVGGNRYTVMYFGRP